MIVTSQDIALSVMSRAQDLAQGLELYRKRSEGRDDLAASLEAVFEALIVDWGMFMLKRHQEAAGDR